MAGSDFEVSIAYAKDMINGLSDDMILQTRNTTGSAISTNRLGAAKQITAFIQKTQRDSNIEQSRIPRIVTKIQTTPMLVTLGILAIGGLFLLRAIR